MTAVFQVNELMRIAVLMEVNGRDFYTAVAGRIADATARAVFAELAAQEEHHRAAFERMLEEADPDVEESPEDEYEHYLKAYADSHVFTAARQQEILAVENLDAVDALRFGIDSEKDAILYYTDMMNLLAPDDRKPVRRIIAEERRHFARLVGLMRQAAGR